MHIYFPPPNRLPKKFPILDQKLVDEFEDDDGFGGSVFVVVGNLHMFWLSPMTWPDGGGPLGGAVVVAWYGFIVVPRPIASVAPFTN